ncbi:hypothetical protein BHE74_00004991 [Ensete ventricosum]|nr:hypothetical protein BHE74_00004991 [Ensete ventricosum]
MQNERTRSEPHTHRLALRIVDGGRSFERKIESGGPNRRRVSGIGGSPEEIRDEGDSEKRDAGQDQEVLSRRVGSRHPDPHGSSPRRDRRSMTGGSERRYRRVGSFKVERGQWIQRVRRRSELIICLIGSSERSRAQSCSKSGSKAFDSRSNAFVGGR